MVDLVAVVAMARNRVIGRDGEMPWRLPTDLARFRRLTTNKPMIMGRKTLDAIGRVLDDRDTVVLTRQGTSSFDGAILAPSPEAAIARAAECADRRGSNEIVVAGGGEVYALFFDRLARLYVTHVDAEPEGDASFLTIDPALWRIASEEHLPADAKNSAATRFTIYERRRPDLGES